MTATPENEPRPEASEEERTRRAFSLIREHDVLAELAAELHPPRLDAAARARLSDVLARTAAEISTAVGPGARAELQRLLGTLGSATATDAELRILHTQLKAWVEAALGTLPDTLADLTPPDAAGPGGAPRDPGGPDERAQPRAGRR